MSTAQAGWDRTEIETMLRRHGLRSTAQRLAVLQAVAQLGHSTPEEIVQHCQTQGETVNTSTVYRTLEVLESLRVITHTHLTHGSPTYFLVEEQHHVHLVCQGCGEVQDAAAEVVGELAQALLELKDFAVDVAHLSIAGQCRDCRQSHGDAPAGAESTSHHVSHQHARKNHD